MAYGSGYPGGYSDIIDTCAIPQGLSLDGATGNYASTPDSVSNSLQGTESILELSGFTSAFADIPGNTADLSITADFELRWEGYVDNFITGGASDQQYLVSNFSQNVSGFKLFLGSNITNIRFQAAISGSNVSITGTNILPPNTRIRIRVVRVFTTGVTTLFAGLASVDWLSLPALAGGSGVIFANTIIPNGIPTMKIGSGEGIAAFSGRTSNASMVVGATTVFNPDFSTSPWVIGDVATQARLDAAGKTWTLRGNAGVVALAERRSLRLSGVSTFATGKSFGWDFEDGTTTGWQGLSTTISNSATFSHGGTKSLKMVSTVAAGNPSATLTSSGMPTVPGEAWSASLWIRKDPATPARSLQLKLGWFSASGGAGFIGQVVTGLSSTDTFTVFTVTGTAPAGTNFVRVDVTHTGTVAIGDTHYLDDVVLGSVVPIIGDIDVRAELAMDDWTPATAMSVLGKYNTGNRSYRLDITTGGNLQFYWTTDGNTDISRTSTAVVSASDGNIKWVRAILDVDNGAAGHDVKFYTSDDGQTWVQLGTTVTTAGVTSIFHGSAALTVGSIFAGSTQNLVGNVFYVEIRNGIDGTVVAALDLQKKPWVVGATSGAFNLDRIGIGWTLSGAGSVILRAFFSDLDIRVRVSLDDWTPTVFEALLSKWNTGGGYSYMFGVNPSGSLTLGLGSAGGAATATSFASSTVATNIPDTATFWVRVTWRASDKRVQFFTSPDNLIWTQLGIDRTNTRFAIYDSTTALDIGRDGNNSEYVAGVIYYVDIRNGIDGTQIIAFNPAAPPWVAGDAAPTARPDMYGNIFTLFGTAKIIGPTGNCDFTINICGGGYAGGQYATAVYAGGVPCSGQDYSNPAIESNVEEFCILSADCS